MGAFRLRHRYLIVLGSLGALLTVVVAVVTLLGGSYEQRQVLSILDGLRTGAGPGTVEALGRAQDLLLERIRESHAGRMWFVLVAGPALTALVAWIVTLKIRRIDAAVDALVASSERIGHGSYAEPVPRSGVDEVAPLESSLERMRLALTDTTISRDYLSLLLNSMSDAVLVTSPRGRVRTANLAAARLLGYEPDQLLGLEFELLIAEEHQNAFNVAKVIAEPGETVVQTARGQTIPVSVNASLISSEDATFQGHIFVMRDITERKRAERRIRYLARFDTLTKMPNRMQFQHLLHQAITRTTQAVPRARAAVRGHRQLQGSERHVRPRRRATACSRPSASAWRASLPKETVVGRLAGDEFAIFAESLGRRAGEARPGGRARAARAARDLAAAARRRARDRGHRQHRRRALPGARATTSST